MLFIIEVVLTNWIVFAFNFSLAMVFVILHASIATQLRLTRVHLLHHYMSSYTAPVAYSIFAQNTLYKTWNRL